MSNHIIVLECPKEPDAKYLIYKHEYACTEEYFTTLQSIQQYRKTGYSVEGLSIDGTYCYPISEMRVINNDGLLKDVYTAYRGIKILDSGEYTEEEIRQLGYEYVKKVPFAVFSKSIERAPKAGCMFYIPKKYPVNSAVTEPSMFFSNITPEFFDKSVKLHRLSKELREHMAEAKGYMHRFVFIEEDGVYEFRGEDLEDYNTEIDKVNCPLNKGILRLKLAGIETDFKMLDMYTIKNVKPDKNGRLVLPTGGKNAIFQSTDIEIKSIRIPQGYENLHFPFGFVYDYSREGIKIEFKSKSMNAFAQLYDNIIRERSVGRQNIIYAENCEFGTMIATLMVGIEKYMNKYMLEFYKRAEFWTSVDDKYWQEAKEILLDILNRLQESIKGHEVKKDFVISNMTSQQITLDVIQRCKVPAIAKALVNTLYAYKDYFDKNAEAYVYMPKTYKLSMELYNRLQEIVHNNVIFIE